MEQSTLLKIAKEYGSPVYVYDAHKIEDQYKRLTQAFSKVKNLKIHYAAKALTNISVLKFVSKLGAALDTVSIQEVQLGLKAGFAAERIIYTPNGVSLKEIEAYVEPSLIDSRPGESYQFQRLGYFVTDLHSTSEQLLFNKTVGLRDNWAKKKS